MNKNIKKFGILAALGVGAYFLFSSFTAKAVTFGAETLFPAAGSIRKGLTRTDSQSYDRTTKKKGSIVPKGSVFTVLGTVTSSAGPYLVTSLGYLPQNDVIVKVLVNNDVTVINTPGNSTPLSE